MSFLTFSSLVNEIIKTLGSSSIAIMTAVVGSFIAGFTVFDPKKHNMPLRRIILRELQRFRSIARCIAQMTTLMSIHKLGKQKDIHVIQSPRTARLLLIFLTHYKYQEELLGDLEELYHKRRSEYGKRTANAWYYSQVIQSIFAVLLRTITKWGPIVFLGEKISKIIHS